MRKIFSLSSCDTSRRILKESGIESLGFEIQDIKQTPISKEDLDAMKNLAGSYEALFSRRAQKYKILGLKNIELSEESIRNYILQEYTFLKRPVIIDGAAIFIGNSKKTITLLMEHLKPN
ncbi:MAG: arsenate reductase [Bacteroidales bacterium]|nr:arsenate reductase [Bacteroidales bacterium]